MKSVSSLIMATSNIQTSFAREDEDPKKKVLFQAEIPQASREMEEALKNGTITTRRATVSVKSGSKLSFEEAIQNTVSKILLEQRLELGPHMTSDGEFCIEQSCGNKLPGFSLVEGVPTEDHIKRSREKGIALVSKCNGVLTSTFEISIMYQVVNIDAFIAMSLAKYMKSSVAEAKAELEVCDK